MSFRVFAYIGSRALGDFTLFSMFVSSVADMFDDSELTVYYRNDRPYKKSIVSCIPNVKHTLEPSSDAASFPIDVFDGAGYRDRFLKVELEGPKLRRTELVLVQSMFREGMLNSIPLTTFVPPSEKIEPSDQALMDLGLDPDRWVATVYWKEAGYSFRPADVRRDVADAEPYLAVIRHIIEELGGQVIRLGHPSPTRLPKMKGLIDLANIPGSEWLQMYSVWISRFMLTTCSGPQAYGSAFGVPTVTTDHLDFGGLFRDHDYVVPKGRVVGDRVYRGMESYLYNLENPINGWETGDYIHNTAEELVAAAVEMYKSTADCLGWRAPKPVTPPDKRPNSVTLPVPVIPVRPELLVPPSQRPIV